MKTRIWLLTSEYPPLPLGGLGTHVYELATALVLAGHEVHVFVSGEDTQRFRGTTEPHIHFCPQSDPFPLWGHLEWQAKNDAVVQTALLVARAEGLPDVIHCHDWMLYDAAHQLRAHCNRPVIATAHMSYAAFTRWGGSASVAGFSEEARMCSGCDALITVSESMQAILIEAHHLQPHRVRVVHNGLSQAFLTHARTDSGPPSAMRPPTVVCIGRPVPQKGIASLIRSAELVLAEYPEVRYRIIGGAGGHYKNALQEYCRNSTVLRNSVCFEPPIRRVLLPAVYADADLALIPSCYEPFGYAALEAMLAGVCVVAAHVGGLAEIITSGETGFLIPVLAKGGAVVECDPVQLAKKQLELLNNSSLRERVSRSAFDHVLTRFTASAMASATMQCYRDACRNFSYGTSHC